MTYELLIDRLFVFEQQSPFRAGAQLWVVLLRLTRCHGINREVRLCARR